MCSCCPVEWNGAKTGRREIRGFGRLLGLFRRCCSKKERDRRRRRNRPGRGVAPRKSWPTWSCLSLGVRQESCGRERLGFSSSVGRVYVCVWGDLLFPPSWWIQGVVFKRLLDPCYFTRTYRHCTSSKSTEHSSCTGHQWLHQRRWHQRPGSPRRERATPSCA